MLCEPNIVKGEGNYSTTEREALGMIYIVTKLGHYLIGRKFTFHVDHSALLYLVSKATLIGKLARWTLLLQEIELDIIHQPSTSHAIGDYLSLLECGDQEPNGVKEDFLDIGLMRIMAELGENNDLVKWMLDMEFYLSNGTPLKDMPREEHKRLGVWSRSYYVFHGVP